MLFRYAALNSELPAAVRRVYSAGERVILDYARENVRLVDVPRVVRVSQCMIDGAPEHAMVALKLTSFGAREHLNSALDDVDALVCRAKARGVVTLLDAEDQLWPAPCYELCRSHNSEDTAWVYNTYQMYRRDAYDEMCADVRSAHRDGIALGIKLVRGAYLRTQRGGILCGSKSETDAQYERAMTQALGAPRARTLLATHNEASLRYAETNFPRERYLTAQLCGMGRQLGCGTIDYRYVPFGDLTELAPYLLRRLRERLVWER